MIVTVSFPVHMFVDVDTDAGCVVASRVLTPNVATMAQAHNIDFSDRDSHGVYDDETITAAVKILDENNWPNPELEA